MRGVGSKIHAFGVTQRISTRRSAQTPRTHPALVAPDGAAAAVIGVGLWVHAGAVTSHVYTWACNCSAYAIDAHVPGRAGIFAGSAVFRVPLEIDTTHCAQGLVGGADRATFARNALLVFPTGISAAAAVLRTIGRIDANPSAHRLVVEASKRPLRQAVATTRPQKHRKQRNPPAAGYHPSPALPLRSPDRHQPVRWIR